MEDPITPWLVSRAYRQGYFAMGDGRDGPTSFYSTNMRALMPITGIRVSRSLLRVLKQSDVLLSNDLVEGSHPNFQISFDRDFESVIRGCQRDTEVWINEEIIRVWTQIHREGWGHSCEVWKQGELAGGVYGLAIGGCFFAESMFHRVPNASKVALYHMVERCRSLGFELFDAQFANEHTKSLGAYEIPQEEFLRHLRRIEHKPVVWR
ncbi:MAG: leucyl/phenylalanyl-tRNA--protein transferase [Chthonomonas sp.]|nr:leucyl/phenylalanyl-tRNA--protein transferase [Chthonomonas sp.]